MMKPKASKVAARKIIRALERRKGFDWWWEDIYPEDKGEIIREIAEVIEENSRRVENGE